MFEKLKKNKTSLTALVLVLLLIFIYWLMKGEPDSSPVSSSEGQEIVGQELLAELERLKSLNQMDAGFFENQVWRSLKNTNVGVVTQPVGRNNPFVRPSP
jgi:hypothetical protein